MDDSFIIIPPVRPSSDGLCKLIDIEYKFELKFSASGSRSKVLNIPITIGTVPLLNEPLKQSFKYESNTFACDFRYHNTNTSSQIAESNNNIFKPVYPNYEGL